MEQTPEILTFLEPSLEKKLKGHRNAITALFFSPNEERVASGSLDNSILLWDIRGTMRSYRFQGHDEAVTDVTFSPSGKYMASASRDKTVRLWVPTVTGSTGVFKAHSQTVRSVQFSSDGRKIITSSDDKIVKLWDAEKQKFLASFVGHTNWVRCARMSADDSVIASCSDDKTTRLWDPNTGECIHTYKDQKGHGTYLAWHPSGCYVAVGTSKGNVKLFDVRTHSLVQYYNVHEDAITQLAFHPSGSYIITSSKDEKMKILDLLEGQLVFTLSGHTGAVNSVIFSQSGDMFASAGDDKLVFIWKTNFTQLADDSKENVVRNESAAPSTSSKLSTTKVKYQGKRMWHLCYHSTRYPVTRFTHMDNNRCEVSNECLQQSCLDEPNANSTQIEERGFDMSRHVSASSDTPRSYSVNSAMKNVTVNSIYTHDSEDNSVGHISHIPRKPPTPSTYTIPSCMNKSYNSFVTEHSTGDDLFGMIKLKDNDVCYTSGSIEWVGRKRSYPINSGFKLINESLRQGNESCLKRVRRLDNTFSVDNKKKECDCGDVLPTVNAIVDHLNALHEAVDLVDLRLNNLEDNIDKN